MSEIALFPSFPVHDEQVTPFRWRWVVLAIVLCAEVMDLLDSTIITISAPTVPADLGDSTATMQWWAAGYTLAFGIFLIVGGRRGDAYGRRRLFLIGIAGFTVASALRALAPSPDVQIGTRVLQGRSAPSVRSWASRRSAGRSWPAGSSGQICSAPAGG